MGLLRQKIKELPRHPNGRPDTLKAIYEELPSDERQDFVELLFSDIEAPTVAIALKESELSPTATQLNERNLTVAIRRFRQGETRFFDEAGKLVAS